MPLLWNELKYIINDGMDVEAVLILSHLLSGCKDLMVLLIVVLVPSA